MSIFTFWFSDFKNQYFLYFQPKINDNNANLGNKKRLLSSWALVTSLLPTVSATDSSYGVGAANINDIRAKQITIACQKKLHQLAFFISRHQCDTIYAYILILKIVIQNVLMKKIIFRLALFKLWFWIYKYF